MLSKSQLVAEIVEAMKEDGVTLPPRNVKDTLDGLAIVAAEQVEQGEDFTVPGVAKLTYTYRAPQKKGAKYKKGETYVGFGGVEQVAEADSKPVSEQVKLRAVPTGEVSKLKPGTKPEAQKAFLKTAAGKAVRARKAK